MPVADPQYPVNLVVAGRPCLVVGGGQVARRKIESLIACGAAVTVVAPKIDPAIKTQGAQTHTRPYERGEAQNYRLVIAATNDPAVNRQVYEDAEAAGVWINTADEPDNCSFTLPSVVRRGPITIAVATGGRSPAMATWLRDCIEARLGEEYVTLLELLSQEREAIKAQGRSTEGLDWLSALDSNMLELVRAGRIDQARERLQACLSSS
jgi:precorrin-2 dehydrogenase/sirohydrochlorin ferrochelatase